MAIGNFAGAIPAGKLAQRFGLRTVLFWCFVLAIALSSARALLLSFPVQVVLALFSGVTLSAWAVCLSPSVAQLSSEKQRPLAFSLVFSLGIGVGALGSLAGSRLPGLFAGHHVLFGGLQPDQIVLLLSCCIVAFGLWPVTRLTFVRPDMPHTPPPARSRPMVSPSLVRFLPAVAMWGLVTGSYSPFASVYFSQHLHMPLPQIGNTFSISQIAQVGAVLAAPLLFKRHGLIRGIVATQLAAAALLLTLAAIGHPIGAAAAYISFTAFQWMNEPGLYSLLMNMTPAEDRGSASAANSLVVSASQAIAAMLAGAAFVRYGYPVALRTIAVIAVAAAAIFWSMRSLTPGKRYQ